MKNLLNTIKKLKPKNKEQAGNYIILAMGVLLALGCVIMVIFSPPSEAREIDKRIQEINNALPQLEYQLTNTQIEWTKLDVEHTQYDLLIEGIKKEKGEVELRGEELRTRMKELQDEKFQLIQQLGVIKMGLASGK